MQQIAGEIKDLAQREQCPIQERLSVEGHDGTRYEFGYCLEGTCGG